MTRPGQGSLTSAACLLCGVLGGIAVFGAGCASAPPELPSTQNLVLKQNPWKARRARSRSPSVLKPVATATPAEGRRVGSTDEGLRQRATILVLPLRPVGDLAEHVPALLTQMLLASLSDVDNLKTVGIRDIAAMLDVERKKDALGCDTTACVAELGGAMGAGLVLHGDLGPLGRSYSINVSVVDTRRSEVAARVSRVVPRQDEKLAAEVPEIVAEIVAKLNR